MTGTSSLTIRLGGLTALERLTPSVAASVVSDLPEPNGTDRSSVIKVLTTPPLSTSGLGGAADLDVRPLAAREMAGIDDVPHGTAACIIKTRERFLGSDSFSPATPFIGRARHLYVLMDSAEQGEKATA